MHHAKQGCGIVLAIAVSLACIFIPTIDDCEAQSAGRKPANVMAKAEMEQRGKDKIRLSYVKALDEALKEANKHYDLVSQEFKVTIKPSDEGWSVWLVFLPETPGADLMIRVSRGGEVKIVGGF